jgi:hypothetical protein
VGAALEVAGLHIGAIDEQQLDQLASVLGGIESGQPARPARCNSITWGTPVHRPQE